MSKVKCPNGHVFDTAIYGTNCPICNAMVGAGASAAAPDAAQPMPQPSPVPSARTHIGGVAPSPLSESQGATQMVDAAPDAVGATMVNPIAQPQPQAQPRPQVAPPAPPRPAAPVPGGRTMIRRPVAQGAQPGTVTGRKLVGFLVTYNRTPLGKAYPIYEGRNYVGRDASCDICVKDDTQMSGRHMSILYRGVDNKFKFRDEQSSNGTFINKELLDDGELNSYDIIRVGGTIFVFVPIPQI